MWFKNLRVYRFTEELKVSPEELHALLEPHAFSPCGSLDPAKYGWVPPLGREGSEFVHAVGDCTMICAKRQEKVLPSAVVKEALEEKIIEINNEESRHVSRAERQTLQDEIIFSLLPRALTKSSFDFGYIDAKARLFIVNASSAKRAEDLISALREAVGTLKLIPFTPMNPAVDVMTSWLRQGEASGEIKLGEECELSSVKESRVIRCKNQDLSADEVRQHLESGLRVTKLAISWKEAIHCVIDEQFAFKRLKYDDEVLEKADDSAADTKAAEFDNEFAIMSLELRSFLKAISEAFGGIEKG